MAVEEQRLRVRRSLEEKLGVEEASYLMDRPVGGWSDLVTNHTLDLKFLVFDERMDALEAKMDARFAIVDERFASLEAQMDTRLRALEAQMDTRLRALEAQMDTRLRAVEDRIGAMAVALGHELRAEMERGFRKQTWALLTAVIAGMGVMGAIFAGLVVTTGT